MAGFLEMSKQKAPPRISLEGAGCGGWGNMCGEGLLYTLDFSG